MGQDSNDSSDGTTALQALPPWWVKDVKRKLIDLGWTRRTLAEKCGTDESAISRMFRHKPSRATVDKVASVLGMPDPFDADAVRDEWLELGMLMRAKSPEQFHYVLEALRKWDAALVHWQGLAVVMSGKPTDRTDG